MKELLKKILPVILIKILSKLRVGYFLIYNKTFVHRYLVHRKWVKDGKPVPPPYEVKQMIISSYRKKYGHSIFIETGTFMGDMVEAQRKSFRKIISIELSCDLFIKAKSRFAPYSHILLFQGDSGRVLPQIMNNIDGNAIFWLDGHYSEGITAKGDKNSPIYEEVDSILTDKSFKHVLLIDDARCFTGKDDYPTIKELADYIHELDDRYSLEVKDDIIRVTIL